MSDRELLEAAAKAAGIVILRSRLDDPMARDMLAGNSARNPHHENGPWNPLTDDGDALRLAVKLEIDIDFVSHHAPGQIVVFTDGNWSEFCAPDPYAATRRAIVRAAAAMAPEVQP